MTLELHATPEEVMRAVEALREFALSRGLAEDDIFALCLALEECGSNIVNHALQRDPRLMFRVQIDHSDGALTLELTDSGPEFDPTGAPARPENSADDDPPGGWGIQLVRRYVNKIHYKREAGENRLRLTRKLHPPSKNDLWAEKTLKPPTEKH